MKRFFLFPLLGFMAVGVMLLGCGDNPSELEMLSFATIAGEWTGTITEMYPDTSYLTMLTLRTEAQVGSVVGSSDYPDFGCVGDLSALKASEPDYIVEEDFRRHGFCAVRGHIHLTHDPVAGTLNAEWCCRLDGLDGAAGILTRTQGT